MDRRIRSPRTSSRKRNNQGRAPLIVGTSYIPPRVGSDVRTLHDLLRDRLRRADYRADIFGLAEDLNKRCPTGDKHDGFFLKSRVLVSVVRDYRGQDDAHEAVATGGAMLDDLERGGFDSGDTQEVRREQIRFAAHFVRMHHYRRYRQYDTAVTALGQCLKLADKVRQPQQFPMFSTQSEISYFLGCALRQSGRLEAAVKEYHNATEWARRRAEYRIELCARGIETATETSEQVIESERSFAQHRAAVVSALGLGWVAYTRGRLDQALNDYVNPAQIVFMGSRDPIHRAYAALIRGSILRALAGTSEIDRLEAALADINESWTTLSAGEYDHPAYATRAASELAQCHIRLSEAAMRQPNGNTARHQDHVKQAATFIKHMERRADARWASNAKILRSRIARYLKNPKPSALTLAQEAQSLVAHDSEPLARVDALITLGEAYAAKGDHQQARDHFTQALAESERSLHASDRKRELDNPKIRAILHLHIARTHLEEDRRHFAQSYLERASSLLPAVEHGFIHEQMKELRARLADPSGSFVIASDTKDLKYHTHQMDLQRWLLRQAIERLRGSEAKNSEIAELLGITTPTVATWRAERRRRSANPALKVE